MRKWKRAQRAGQAIIEMLFLYGTDGYMIEMLFIIATVLLARIMLKIATKQYFKYSNILSFCTIGLILAIILKCFNLNFQKKIIESVICLSLNIIIFIIFKNKDKILQLIHKR